MTLPKRVLITGTSSGIGRTTAQTLASQGHTVFATMRQVETKNAPAAEDLRNWAAQEGVKLQVVELDVTNQNSIQTAVQQVVDTAGGIDVLINNAGWGIFGLAEAFTVDQCQRLFETNVFGPMRVVQAVLPHMRRQQQGLLVYLSSTAATIPYPFMGVYGASKAALEGIALTFNSELYSLGIDTVIIQAGSHRTDFGTRVETSAREGIHEAYGPIGHASNALIESLPTYFTSEWLSSAESLSDQIASYINLPAGERPLKVGLGVGTEGFEDLNQGLIALQRQAIELAGFGQFISR
jgi:NAD(P)-dependent dehydrogenase (short-subunit alcohol dehydrogenase family)